MSGAHEGRAGRHRGPIATRRTRTLKAAFEAFPEAIEPALSRQNQESTPVTTVRRTASGAAS